MNLRLILERFMTNKHYKKGFIPELELIFGKIIDSLIL